MYIMKFTKYNNQFPDKKKREESVDRMVAENALGFIEDVYSTGTSFNVYRWLNRGENTYIFVRSCYKRSTADMTLDNLCPKQAQPKQLHK